MNMPSFTAEASVYPSTGHYQTLLTSGSVPTSQVQPSALGKIYRVCGIDPTWGWVCYECFENFGSIPNGCYPLFPGR